MATARSTTRSPLKGKPLRNPGQSLDDTISDKLMDVLPWILLPGILIVLASLEWYRVYVGLDPFPELATAAATVSVVIGYFGIRRRIREVRRLQQGRDGERAVGQFLERLRVSGWHLFHDVPGDGFNLDHIAIGPGGIYAIETKTWSKPSKGRPRITVDAQGVSAAGHAPNRDPLVQGVAQARWLSELLRESTGRHLTVQAAILFPGWYIEDSRGRGARPWVLEPKVFPKFLEREPVSLREDEAYLASFHLSRYIKSES